MNINKNVGHQIRYYRKKLNLTQQELADQIGISWEMISRYERGSSSPLYKIKEIANALNIEPYELFITNNHEPTNNNHNNDNNQVNNIPLFTSIPENNDFTFENTSFSYTAPDWIIQKYENVFAVDPTIINISTIQLEKAGVIYVNASTQELEPTDLVLYSKEDQYHIKTNNNIEEGTKIGKILAQEIRL